MNRCCIGHRLSICKYSVWELAYDPRSAFVSSFISHTCYPITILSVSSCRDIAIYISDIFIYIYLISLCWVEISSTIICWKIAIWTVPVFKLSLGIDDRGSSISCNIIRKVFVISCQKWTSSTEICDIRSIRKNRIYLDRSIC